MSEEKKNAAEQIGTLNSCLLEGDSEQKARERKIKRRALAISIALQCAAIVALVLVPLLGRTEKISLSVVTPMPPYRHVAARPIEHRVAAAPQPPACRFCAPNYIPGHIVTVDHSTTTSTAMTDGDIDFTDSSNKPDANGLINLLGRNNSPVPPDDADRNKKKRISVGGLVQQAMLIRRVEPSYPQLAKQTRVSGQVHLHAIISTDGNIASLQVIDGHPLLVQSALDAVGQWRYKPTLLNGQAVEVETIITVIYSLGQQ